MVLTEEQTIEYNELANAYSSNDNQESGGTSDKKIKLTFNNSIVSIQETILLSDYESINGAGSYIYNHSDEDYNIGYLTIDNLHKGFRYQNKQEGTILNLIDDLIFYYRVKLDSVFTNLKYSFNKLINGLNILLQIIPAQYDTVRYTYKPILEFKDEAGNFIQIQLHSFPLFAELDYDDGYLFFNQDNIENTNNLFRINELNIYLSFIRYEGNFGVTTGTGTSSAANLQDWSDASFNNVDISINGLITMYNTFNFSDLSDNNVPTKSQIKELAENNFFFFFNLDLGHQYI